MSGSGREYADASRNASVKLSAALWSSLQIGTDRTLAVVRSGPRYTNSRRAELMKIDTDCYTLKPKCRFFAVDGISPPTACA